MFLLENDTEWFICVYTNQWLYVCVHDQEKDCDNYFHSLKVYTFQTSKQNKQ